MSKPEKKLQDNAIRFLRERGIYYLNLYGDGMSGKGKPDIIACINGRFVAFELKVGENDLQDDQKSIDSGSADPPAYIFPRIPWASL